MIENISIKKIEPIRVAYIRDIVESYQHAGKLFEKLHQQLKNDGVVPTGPFISIYYDMGYKEKDVDVEACVPIGDIVESNSLDIRVLDELPQAACLVYKGSYSGFMDAYNCLMEWIDANDYKICGPNREIYLVCCGMTEDENEYVTEIQFPITVK